MNPPRALVITHGKLGAELVRVTELILGPAEDITAMSNQGLSNLDLVEHIRKWVAAGEDQVEVIFVDDYAGSCGTAARLACEQRPDVIVITGVNLAMLLGFLTWREDTDREELAQRLVDKGREAISRVGPGR